MSHRDGRRSLGSEKVHLESIAPQITFPVSADMSVTVDDSTPVRTEIVTPVPVPVTGSFQFPPYKLSVPAGNVAGVSSANIFGRNLDIDSGSSPEDVWMGSGIWVAPTTARLHDIVSTSALDAAAGTGAQSVLVEGLDATGLIQSETIALNGTTVVTTVNTYTMINRLRVTAVGSLGANAGIITATAQTDVTITAMIATGDNRSLMAIYQIPSDKMAYMTAIYANVRRNSNNGSGLFTLLVKTTGGWEIDHAGGLQIAGMSGHDRAYDPYVQYPSGSLIKVQASVNGNNQEAYAGFDLYLIDN